MAAKKKLTANVAVDGTWYGPAHGNVTPDKKVAEQITNPDAWADDDTPVTEQPAADPGTATVDPDRVVDLTGVGEGFDPDASVADILEWVGDDPVRARLALDAETVKSDPRISLTSKLEPLAAGS